MESQMKFSNLYLELNEVQLNESPHLGTIITPFDGGDFFFESEKANRFVKKFEFEADTTTPIVDAFHQALGQTLRASSSEHELYGVVHEHRAGTKTTWKPTKDLELISHLFELSLNKKDEDVLSEHNICDRIETRFRADVQSENAPKAYTLLKDSQTIWHWSSAQRHIMLLVFWSVMINMKCAVSNTPKPGSYPLKSCLRRSLL